MKIFPADYNDVLMRPLQRDREKKVELGEFDTRKIDFY